MDKITQLIMENKFWNTTFYYPTVQIRVQKRQEKAWSE